MAAPSDTQASSDRLQRILKDAHLWGAMVGIAMQPISTATGNIGFGIALASALPRLPAVKAELASLLRQGWMRCLLAWLAWSWLSLVWSPDRVFGIEQFRATRVLLWIPVLWPIRHAWRPLVWSILAGTTMMAIVQALQVVTGWPPAHFGPGSGLTTPTQTGLWAAVAMSFWLILVVSTSLGVALATLPATTLAGLALVWSATRASAIGLAVELVLANVVLALTCRGWIGRAAVRCAVGLVILAAAWAFAGAQLKTKMSQALNETTQSLRGGHGITSEVRIAMWKGALENWRDRPIAGGGIGCVPSVMQRTTVQNERMDMRTVRMIHSTYVQTLVETGIIGLGLLLAFIALLLRDVLRGLQGQPLLVASFGALVVWLVASAFDGYQQSGGFLSVGAILIPLALADVRSIARTPAST